MSTIYGTIETKEGKIDVDASQIGNRVALIINDTTYLRIKSASEVRRLIECLNIAISHVWGGDETA